MIVFLEVTKVSFYILKKKETKDQRLQVLLRIVEKAYLNGHKIYIACKNRSEAENIDSALWVFKQDRFIPHGMVDSPEGKIVAVGWGQEPELHNEVLINLLGSVPSFFSRFDRLIEIVDSNESDLMLGREHWKFYKDRGYPLKKYDI